VAIEVLLRGPLPVLQAGGAPEHPSWLPREALLSGGIPDPLTDEILFLTTGEQAWRRSSLEPILRLLESP
jgi:hypothetical protein